MLMGSEDVLNAKEGMIEQEQRNTEPENRIVRAVCGISLTRGLWQSDKSWWSKFITALEKEQKNALHPHFLLCIGWLQNPHICLLLYLLKSSKAWFCF